MDEVPEYYTKRIILSREEEIELVLAAKNGDKEARDKLVMANLSLVHYLAKQKRQHKDLEILDHGVQGILISIEKFDLSRGYRFATFAMHWIIHQIIEGLQLKNNLSKMSHKTRQDCIERHLMNPIDLSENVFYNLHSVLPSIEKDLTKFQMKEDVRRSLTTLTEREVDILYNHVMEESCTLSDLGVKYGLSRERIRQVEEEALKKLRFKLRNWKNFPDDDER